MDSLGSRGKRSGRGTLVTGRRPWHRVGQLLGRRRLMVGDELRRSGKSTGGTGQSGL